ncbi:MarR family winged helix-turn-helix transcriptional regulator [Laedolimicola intestinihominis]|uniref:MarR family transcriptional regulator n=1 Tax=Laedolimicola intestinihominis TaxID=3133166 RepID=A0ABV1FEF1_9FIRM
MVTEIEFPRKLLLAYNAMCKPLCKKLGLPQTAFDILMFLGNNPEYRTARDIVEVRDIKANLVSVNVERLVQEGYLKRRSVAGDRRKTELLCTEKAKPLIKEGRAVQLAFGEKLFAQVDEETRRVFVETLDSIGKNAEEILKGEH